MILPVNHGQRPAAAGAAGESFVVTVNGRAIADVVPHRSGTVWRRFVPVAEVAEAFAADPAPDAASWLADLATADEIFGPDEPTDPFAVSAVTIGELQYGVATAADPLTQMHRRRRVQAILDRFELLSFDVVAAEYYGTFAALVRRHGRNPRPRRMDLQIAAIAARHGLTLLTRNARDFEGLESALDVVDLLGQP